MATTDPASYIGVKASVKTCASMRVDPVAGAPPTALRSVAHRTLGEAHEGIIFTYDTTTSTLVLEQRKGANPKVRRSRSEPLSRTRA